MSEINFPQKIDAELFARRLCEWQKVHGRHNLPWFTRDPYRRWLSEIMLQQTQVSVVRGYFERFLHAFPTVQDLAQATQEDVMRLWSGLGYYSRARNLHKAAQLVAAAGAFPQTSRLWQELPSVGKSTAAALASFCNDEAAAVCDGNVKRVLARLFAIEEPIDRTAALSRLEKLAGSLVSRTEPGCYNQAMMDLGATICTRTTPDCGSCPVSELCRAHALGAACDYPKKSRTACVRRALVHVLLALEKDGSETKVWLVRRDQVQRGMGHWKGLWSLPETDAPAGAEIARFEHVMSHVRLTVAVHASDSSEMPPQAFAVNVADLAAAPLPAPVKKFLQSFVSV